MSNTKVWKARLEAYEELIKHFKNSSSEQDDCFSRFATNPELFKGIVTDSNVVAQEQGIEALCSCLEYGGSNVCLRLRSVVVTPLCEKGLSSNRPGTKQKSIDALLWFIELDTPDPIIEQILPVLSARLPKLVASVTKSLTEIVSAFGTKTVPAKPIMSAMPKLFAHADKNVRAEATSLMVELYKWVGPALESVVFPDLKPVQQKDLSACFAKVKDEKPEPTRFLKSQREAMERQTANGLTTTDQDVEMADVKEDTSQADAYDLIDAVDVLSKLPADLNERINSSVWKDRKEVLEEVHGMFDVMKLANGDYSDFIRNVLTKSIKDANVQVVQLAANIVEFIAKGLRFEFQRYVHYVLAPLLERLKEKKPSVSEALSRALDACFTYSSFSEIFEETVAAMAHKTPQVKIEAAKFFTRCLKSTNTPPSKEQIDIIMEKTSKLLADSQAPVRNGAAEVIGTLMKITGERALNPLMQKIEDRHKPKIQDCFQNAQVCSKLEPTKPTPKVTAKPPVKAIPSRNSSRQSLAPPPTLSKKPGSVSIPAKRGPSSPLKRPEGKQTTGNVIRGNGLTSRTLGSNNSHSYSPRLDVSLAAAEKAELEELRKEKKAWGETREKFQWQQSEFQAEKARLMQEIQSLSSKNENLMDDHTKVTLLIKSRDTQLARMQSDLESSRSRVLELESELNDVKRKQEISSQSSDNQSPFIDENSDLAKGNSRIGADLSKKVSRLSIDNRSELKPAESGFGWNTSRDFESSDESWKRAAEVTSQLKARIEKMKAKSRSNISSYRS